MKDLFKKLKQKIVNLGEYPDVDMTQNFIERERQENERRDKVWQEQSANEPLHLGDLFRFKKNFNLILEEEGIDMESVDRPPYFDGDGLYWETIYPDDDDDNSMISYKPPRVMTFEKDQVAMVLGYTYNPEMKCLCQAIVLIDEQRIIIGGREFFNELEKVSP